MFPYLFSLFLIALVIYDRLFIYPVARMSWKIMFVLFLGGAFLSLNPRPLRWITERVGVGRPVDAIVYIVLALVIREIFHARIKNAALRAQISELTRQIAIQNRKTVSSAGRIDG